MTRHLLIALVAALTCCSALHADNLQLTLDLRNNNYANAMGGGTWQLFARVVEAGDGPEGTTGIAGVRALLDKINVAGISFNPAINPNGIATAQAIPGDAEGTVEIVYRQDLTQPTLSGVGVPPAGFPNRDMLIASGSWPAGPRPVFGTDTNGASSGEFLSEGGTTAVNVERVPTSIVTLGDFNGSGTVTNLDINFFVRSLPGGNPFVPYNPAGDINQSGYISNLDIGPFVGLLAGPIPTTIAVPEPAALGLVAVSLLCSMSFCNPRLYSRRS